MRHHRRAHSTKPANADTRGTPRVTPYCLTVTPIRKWISYLPGARTEVPRNYQTA
jgi:hypothetical protein